MSVDSEGTESSGTTNGTSVSLDSALADDRAAFMAGNLDEANEGGKSEEKIDREIADDDSDLEDEQHDEVDEDEVDEDEDAEDDDSDLDEDEDEDGKEGDGKVDSETAKRLEQVRRTDKRLREQREKDWAAREVEFESRVKAVEEKLATRIEAAERIEKVAARASIDPVAALQALGVKEDAFAYIGQVLYTHAKAKDDPKAQAAYAQMLKERELSNEVQDLKRWREEREKTDKELAEQAAADRQLEAFFDSVTKAATDKTPLAQAYVKANPAEARERLQVIAFRLAKESGKLPDAKKVMIEFEKDRRKVLRDMGIDPKSRGAAAASASANDSRKNATTKGDKKAAKKPTTVVDDDEKPWSREDFVALNGRYD